MRRFRKHAILETQIEEVIMQLQHHINVLHTLHLFDEYMPIGLNDLDHHIILQILNGVHHALSQRKRRSIKLRGSR